MSVTASCPVCRLAAPSYAHLLRHVREQAITVSELSLTRRKLGRVERAADGLASQLSRAYAELGDLKRLLNGCHRCPFCDVTLTSLAEYAKHLERRVRELGDQPDLVRVVEAEMIEEEVAELKARLAASSDLVKGLREDGLAVSEEREQAEATINELRGEVAMHKTSEETIGRIRELFLASDGATRHERSIIVAEETGCGRTTVKLYTKDLPHPRPVAEPSSNGRTKSSWVDDYGDRGKAFAALYPEWGRSDFLQMEAEHWRNEA